MNRGIKYWFDFCLAYALIAGFALLFVGDAREDFMDAVAFEPQESVA